jgi:8-oxo-dGTP diphosphatase
MQDEKFFIGVKALIKNQRNEILILKSGPLELKSTQMDKPFWDLPGGKMKIGENVEQTLRREVSEELGIDRNGIEILDIFDASVSKIKISHGQKISLMLITYRCNLLGGEMFKLTLEHDEYRWSPVNEAKKLLKFKYPESFLKKLDSLKV